MIRRRGNPDRQVILSKGSNVQHGRPNRDDQQAREELFLAFIRRELMTFEGAEQPKEQMIKKEVYHSRSTSRYPEDVDTEAGVFISRMRQKMAMERPNTIKA